MILLSISSLGNKTPTFSIGCSVFTLSQAGVARWGPLSERALVNGGALATMPFNVGSVAASMLEGLGTGGAEASLRIRIARFSPSSLDRLGGNSDGGGGGVVGGGGAVARCSTPSDAATASSTDPLKSPA